MLLSLPSLLLGSIALFSSLGLLLLLPLPAADFPLPNISATPRMDGRTDGQTCAGFTAISSRVSIYRLAEGQQAVAEEE